MITTKDEEKMLNKALQRLDHNIKHWLAKKKHSDITTGTIDGLRMAKSIVEGEIHRVKLSKVELMTWATFKKKYSPKEFGVADNTFGTISKIEPTMRNAGFEKQTFWNVDENVKPQYFVRGRYSDPKVYPMVVYHRWKYRDGSGYAITVFYKKAP